MTRATPCKAPRPRALFFNRSYWPDAEATGQLLEELLEDLSHGFDVTVVAGQPNHNPGNTLYQRSGSEHRRGVQICRVIHCSLPKTSFVGRVITLLTYLFMAFLVGLTRPRPAVLVVETDPPLLSLIGSFLRHWHRCRLVVYLQDIYPDIAVALGKLSNGLWTRWARALLFGTYRRADRVIVLSHDMRSFLLGSGLAPDRVIRIPNWVDTSRVYPVKQANAFRRSHNIGTEFVVMYSGNLGLSQDLEQLLDAAELLRDRGDILFLLIGSGAMKPALVRLAARRQLANVRFLPYQPKSQLAQSLSAADLHVVPLHYAAAGCFMPSKLYGAMASGTPILALAPEHSELARLVYDRKLGLVMPRRDTSALADTIRSCADHRSGLRSMGENARRTAVELYDRALNTRRFAQVLRDLLAQPASPTECHTQYAPHGAHPELILTS